MKKKLLALSVLMICLSLISLGTLAYFNAEDTAHNVISSGSVNIELVEKTKGDDGKLVDFPKDGILGVMPGTAVSKIVTVKNTGESAAYIRVWVDSAISEQGDPITNPLIKNLPMTITVDGEEVDVLTMDYNTEDWTKGEDGYWYYNKALKVGESTEALFENVAFHKLMGNVYQNSKALVNVSAQATQVANNGESAVEAKGWPET